MNVLQAKIVAQIVPKIVLNLLLSPCQTESQVDASWKLGSTCDSVWPGASWELGSNCDPVWPGLVCTCVDLRWLALTYAHFCRDPICMQVKESFSPFGHPAQINASWVMSIKLLLASDIEDSLPYNVFCDLTCTCEETCESVWPPNLSLHTSSTCVHLRLLAGLFGQGF